MDIIQKIINIIVKLSFLSTYVLTVGLCYGSKYTATLG